MYVNNSNLNMMKFAKLNHMSIITLFAIAFIVVYLYYTISDVKKIHSEVKRMGQDIDKLNQSITNITTTILPMLTFPSAAPQNIPDIKRPVNVKTQDHIDKKNEVEVDNEDVASVGSHELTKIMESIDVDNESNVDIDVAVDDDIKYNIDTSDEVVHVEEINQNITNQEVDAIVSNDAIEIGSMSAEDLKKVPYNNIRKYCKMNNIDDKGSKDVLIYRIKNPPRP
jgi:hypothetical protein